MLTYEHMKVLPVSNFTVNILGLHIKKTIEHYNMNRALYKNQFYSFFFFTSQPRWKIMSV